MDFPGGFVHKPVIASNGIECAACALAIAFNTPTVSSASWPTSNRALYVPMRIQSAYLVRRVWWANGTTAAGNVDVGVHTLGGARLLSGGGTAQAGTNVIQSTALGTPVLLAPGSYMLSFAASSASSTFLRLSVSAIAMQHFGFAQQTTAYPLPDPATFASSAGTFIPIFGIASASVI